MDFTANGSHIKIAWKEGLVLSTLGVILTTFFMGGFTYLVTGLPLVAALLFGAIVSSTDAASVFSILESKKLKLKYDTDTILEFESATNDPIALIIVTILTQIALTTDGVTFGFSHYLLMFFLNIVVGGIVGFGLGWIVRFALRKMNFQEVGLIPIFLLAVFFIATLGAEMLSGSLLITSYIFGVVVGNTDYHGKETTTNFLHSLSWLAQAIMFLLLGLQIFPNQLPEIFLMAIIPAIFLILLGRPTSILLCYLPFRKSPWKKRFFISAIGLKGATPIVFAFIPLVADAPHAQTIFNMVFFVVILSILIQGTAISPLAGKLGLKAKT